MATQNLAPLSRNDILGTSRRGRLHASLKEVETLLGEFKVEPGDNPSYAFRTTDGTDVTIYRRSDTAVGEWSIGGFDDTAVKTLKGILPSSKVLNNREWEKGARPLRLFELKSCVQA